MLENCLTSSFKYEETPRDHKGVICQSDIKADTTIMSFPMENLICSDINIYGNLKKVLSDKFPNQSMLQFCLALKILYHPKKYDYVHQYIIRNYSNNVPFLMPDKLMGTIGNTLARDIIKRCKHEFETMLLSYRIIEEDLSYQMEHRLKIIYSFCCAYSYGLTIDDQTVRCLNPAIIINHSIHHDSPILKHCVQDNKWIIKTDRDYQKGDEIFDCYQQPSILSHPFYHDLQLTDCYLYMSVYRGIIPMALPHIKTYSNIVGYSLGTRGTNEKRLEKLDKIYEGVTQYIKNLDESHPCDKVLLYLCQLELHYYYQFRKQNKPSQKEVDIVIE